MRTQNAPGHRSGSVRFLFPRKGVFSLTGADVRVSGGAQSSLVERDVLLARGDGGVAGTDDLAAVCELLYTVRAPAGYSRHGEKRRIKLGRDLEHGVDEARIEVHVRADALVHPAFFAYDFGGYARDFFVVFVVVLKPFCHCEFFCVVLQDVGARIAERIHGVSYAVHEPRAVESLFVEQTGDVVAYGGIGARGGRLEIGEHLGHLDVSAAVPRTLERAERRRDRGIGVRAGTCHDVVGERRVVAAAVFGVQDEAEVEDEGFQFRILLVGTNEAENVFRRAQILARLVYDEATVRVVVRVHLIAVGGEQGKLRDELYALSEYVGDRDIVGAFVVAVQGEHAARDDVHHVRGRCFHDYVAHETFGQSAELAQHFVEVFQLLFVGQFAEEEQIDRFLKAETLFFHEAAHEILNGDAAVIQLAGALDAVAVLVELVGVDLAYLGESGDDARAVNVAQSAFYVVFFVK